MCWRRLRIFHTQGTTCLFLLAVSYDRHPMIIMIIILIKFLCFRQIITPTETAGSLGLTTVNELISPVEGMLVEALITFVLVLVVQSVCDEKRTDIKGSVPLAIGLTVALCHLAAVVFIPEMFFLLQKKIFIFLSIGFSDKIHGCQHESGKNFRTCRRHRFLGKSLGVLGRSDLRSHTRRSRL